MSNISIEIGGKFQQLNVYGDNDLNVEGEGVEIKKENSKKCIFTKNRNNIKIQVKGEVYQVTLTGKNSIKIIGEQIDSKIEELKSNAQNNLDGGGNDGNNDRSGGKNGENGGNGENSWWDKYTCLLLKITAFAFVFFGLAIVLQRCFDFGISDDSVVIAFIGILATFVVVSNYMQVKSIQDNFATKSNKLENELKKVRGNFTAKSAKIENEFATHIKITQAMCEFNDGIFFLTHKDKSTSLSEYMSSLEILNSVHKEEITDIVVGAIDNLKKADDETLYTSLCLSKENGNKYIQILRESNHKLATDLIRWIRDLPESSSTQFADSMNRLANQVPAGHKILIKIRLKKEEVGEPLGKCYLFYLSDVNVSNPTPVISENSCFIKDDTGKEITPFINKEFKPAKTEDKRDELNLSKVPLLWDTPDEGDYLVVVCINRNGEQIMSYKRVSIENNVVTHLAKTFHCYPDVYNEDWD
jgi:cell division protein ZapA (FtsZ GTPase activity inhibitor)